MRIHNLFGILVLCCLLKISMSCRSIEARYKFPNSNIYVKLVRSTKLQYAIMRGSSIIQSVTLDNFKTDKGLVPTERGSITLSSDTVTIEFELLEYSNDFALVRVSRESLKIGEIAQDCVDLNVGHLHWFGGPQDHEQYWPIERASFTNFSYVTKELVATGIAERYWLSSSGVFFYVEDETPLFIDQNSDEHPNQLCFSAKKELPYDTYTETFNFKYRVGVGLNARDAHLKAVQTVLGKPSDIPDERMVSHPIWSTWALYKRDINEQIVRDFGNDILKYKFNNSQLEIDDDWEDCYGALTIRKSKFPNMTQLTTDLKKLGFRVTLWIHPFINKDCGEMYNEALSKGYLVLNHNGNPDTSWWNSETNQAAYIDFTKTEAAKWFSDRIKRLQDEDGIDSFKFDAGESSWAPPDPVLNSTANFNPSAITRDYIKTVAQFGPLVEVRSGQGTQNLPVFVRMIDKDSKWTWNNGLVTLVTTLLQLNMAGYPFVLPDMIGGNGYDNTPPTKELFIRWLQANVFMPSLQFSYVPWYFDNETISISLHFTALHAKYTPNIMARFKLATETGEPVNAPLWWVDPDDNVAMGIFDQFVLGDDIIAAPVLTEGALERDIYLPKGNWQDMNTMKIHVGPKWLMSYPAPLDVLPYFERYIN